MNIFLQLLYRFFQLFIAVTFKIYFRRIIFIHPERLKAEGPLLVLSNHPNALMDPFMALYRVKKQCFLLANYTLFKNPILNSVLSTLWCIPIQRPKDVDGLPVKNDEAFKKCDEHILRGGSIYIAPEGTSYNERHIRDLKTGAARIAFSAEEKTNFKLDLRILPIGITYDAPLKFRSNVVVEIGELLTVDDWQTAHKTDSRKAIQDFTQHLENSLINVVVHCKDAEEDAFLQKLDTLLQSENALNTEGAYHRSKELLTKINAWEKADFAGFQKFKSEVENYFETLNSLKINDLNIKKNNSPNIFMLILSLPVFIFGFVNNIIPAWLSNALVGRVTSDKTYDTTVRYCAGLILFPIFWGIQTKILYGFFNPVLPWWAYYLSLIPTGLVAWWSYTEGVNYLKNLKYKKLDSNRKLSETRLLFLEKMQGNIAAKEI